MHKLLVNAPTGQQAIVMVEESGAYYDQDRVIWDERVDGPLPDDIVLGGAVRVEGSRAVDAVIDEETEEVIEPAIEAVPASLGFSQELLDSRPAVVVNRTVSMAQARKALVLSGVTMASIEAALNAIEDAEERELALIDWEYATTVRSQSPLVQGMAAALAISPSSMSAMFDLAETL